MLHRLAPLPPSAPSPYILLTSTRPTPTELGRTLATRLYDLSSAHREGGEGNLWRHASTHDNARRHAPARPVTVAKDGGHRRGLCVSPPCVDERRGEASRPCVLEIAEPVGAFQSPRSSSDGLGVAQPSHLASRRRHQSRRPSRPGGLVQPTASVYPRPSTAGTHWNGALPSLARPCLPPPANVPYVHAPGGGPPRRGLGLGGLARLLGCCRKTSCLLCSTSGHRTRAQEQAWQRHHQRRLVPACNETRVAGEMSAEGQIWEPHR